MRHGLFASLVLSLMLPLAVSAQGFDDSLSSGEPFTISVTPQYPAPYGTATLSFVSSSLDLTNATLKVALKGKQIYQGSVQPVGVSLAGAGSVAPLSVTITTNGVPYSKSLTVQPQDVSIIAEPIASAPALYLGKPLIPLEGDTRIVAVANLRDAAGKTIDPANLSYTWTVDGAQIFNSSGIGKQSVVVASPLQYRARTVSVAVQSQNGTLVGGADLILNPVEPHVRIYENDPLLGIRFERALGDSYSIAGAETSLFAAPFSLPITGGVPFIQWFLNGAAAQTGSSITLRPAGSGQGTASLSLTASRGESAPATASLSLIFGTKSGSNFFGL